MHAARQLGSRGVKVYIASTSVGANVFKASRYCEDAANFPADDAAKFCNQVRDWAAGVMDLDGRVPVIPLSDMAVQYLDAGRAAFPKEFCLGIPAHEVVQSLMSKESSLAIAERAGLEVPRWVSLTAREDAHRVRSLKLPVIVRPTTWDSAGSTYFKFAVFRDHAGLDSFVGGVLAEGASLIVQEYVSVDEGAIEFGLVWRSQDATQTVVCTGRKMRQSAREGGVMAWGATNEDATLRVLSERFLEEAGFTGLGGTEFIRHGDHRWFVEFNPRAEAIHYLADGAGQPHLWWHFKDLRGDARTVATHQRPAAVWVGPAWLERIRTHPADAALLVRDRMAFSRLQNRQKSVWSMSDPWPGFRLVRLMAEGALRKVARILRCRLKQGLA